MRLPASRPAAVRGTSLTGLINTPSLTRPAGEARPRGTDLVRVHARRGSADDDRLNNQSLTPRFERRAKDYLESFGPVRMPLRINCRNTRVILEEQTGTRPHTTWP